MNTQCLYSGGGISLSLFRLQILSVYTSCQLTGAEESEVGAAMVANGSVRRLPTSNKLEDGLRRSEGIGHVLERVEEDLRKNRECLNLNISDSHLNHEQDDEEEDEGGVEVGDVEGGAEPPDQCVPSDHHGQQHRGQLRAQVGHQAGIVVIRKVKASMCRLFFIQNGNLSHEEEHVQTEKRIF